MKLLVLGANGQVGFELRRALAPFGDIVAATRDGMLAGGGMGLAIDLADSGSLRRGLEHADADIVVNAAAYTAVDRAEDDVELADRINHLALAEIGAWAARRGALVVHYSTDYVFDGSATRPYREDDTTAPLGVYGRSKLAGEQALRASGAAHFILRTAWVYAARGGSFLRTMVRLAAERDELRVVADQVGAPTSAASIADLSACVLLRWRRGDAATREALQGTYHLVARGSCSWHAFAEAIVREAHARGILTRTPRVTAIATRDYPTRAARPARSVLAVDKLESSFDLECQDWQTAMRVVLDEIAAARVET